MAETLASATLALARLITDVSEGIATSGSATTVADTSAYNPDPDDYWNNGTIWLLAGSGTGLNTGKSAIISDYDVTGTTGTWTFATLTALCAAGDRYAVAAPDYPRQILRQAVNQAISAIGNIPQQDITVPTVANQERYTLPATVWNVKAVQMASSTASPYYYVPQNHWEEINGYIYFKTGCEPATTGYILRIWYEAPAAELTTDTGAVSNYIHIERLKWEAAVHALYWRLGKVGTDEPIINAKLALAKSEAQRMAMLHPIPRLHQDFKYAPYVYGYHDDELEDINRVSL